MKPKASNHDTDTLLLCCLLQQKNKLLVHGDR